MDASVHTTDHELGDVGHGDEGEEAGHFKDEFTTAEGVAMVKNSTANSSENDMDAGGPKVTRYIFCIILPNAIHLNICLYIY